MKAITSKLLLIVAILTAILTGCTNSQPVEEEKVVEAKCTVPSQYTNETTMTDETNPQLAPPKEGDKIATIETKCGTIKLKLFATEVPEMTKNFEELAKAGKYDGVPFHRVIKDFMIQTGDFTNQNGTGGYSYKGPDTSLPDEINRNLKHLYGTVSMANRGPNTNGSQFFIVTNKEGTPHLDDGYTIFGQVYEGIDVALTIADFQSSDSDKPTEIINMDKVTIETYTPEPEPEPEQTLSEEGTTEIAPE
jgi:peptidyl-prolyl cis-trans isomerase B (cyclophilin B)